MPKKRRSIHEVREDFVIGCKFIERARREYCNKRYAVLGIDPSISSTGWAYRSLYKSKTGVITPSTYGFSRLARISRTINKLTKKSNVFVGIEDYSYNSTYGRERAGELGGVIRKTLYLNSRPLIPVAVQSLKAWIKARSKAQIMVEILDRYDIKITNEDAADAFIIADIVYKALILARLIVVRKVNAEEVRLFMRDEEYKSQEELRYLYKYQANSLFNLIAKHGSKCEFFLKSKPTLERNG